MDIAEFFTTVLYTLMIISGGLVLANLGRRHGLNIVNLKGRLNRIQFLIGTIAIYLFLMILNHFTQSLIINTVVVLPAYWAVRGMMIIGLIIAVPLMNTLYARRFHDFNIGSGLAILWTSFIIFTYVYNPLRYTSFIFDALIFMVSLVLLIIPGNQFPNIYGKPSTWPNKQLKPRVKRQRKPRFGNPYHETITNDASPTEMVTTDSPITISTTVSTTTTPHKEVLSDPTVSDIHNTIAQTSDMKSKDIDSEPTLSRRSRISNGFKIAIAMIQLGCIKCYKTIKQGYLFLKTIVNPTKTEEPIIPATDSQVKAQHDPESKKAQQIKARPDEEQQVEIKQREKQESIKSVSPTQSAEKNDVSQAIVQEKIVEIPLSFDGKSISFTKDMLQQMTQNSESKEVTPPESESKRTTQKTSYQRPRNKKRRRK